MNAPTVAEALPAVKLPPARNPRHDATAEQAPKKSSFIPWLVAVRVYPAPGRLIDRLENEATPLLVLTVLLPESVPLPGFAVDVMATVMAAFAFVTVFPN